MAMKSNQLSKEQLINAARIKRECNAKAQAIVVLLLEKNVDENNLLDQLKHINQSHYDDVVDERHILQLCGYPLCDNQLEKIPSQRYQISTATNKVYDITDRKKFCSSHCFKASAYLRSQILESPLWLRNSNDIPEFKILEHETNTQ